MELIVQEHAWKREEFAPLSFWAWNDEMDEESIRTRVREFHEQGFGGFFMHSRGGLLTPYLSDDWFRACRTAAMEAEKYGMQAWIYDEDGWPSGFAGGRVNGLGEEYVSKHFDFLRERPDHDERVIAAYRYAGTGYQRCESQEADLWAVYESEPDYADLLSAQVTKAFLEITYERYKRELGEYFGNTVPGFFTDEPQFFRTGYPYSFELTAYFKKRNGYEMEEGLYQLLPSVSGKKSEQFRLDFWNTIQEMMEEHYSRPIYEWCGRNGVIFTGHYPGEDSLIHQMTSTAGVMPKYALMQMPGIDHLGRRITSQILTKQVTSVAKQLGRKKVLSETFGCAGWNIPFEDLCYIWGWQASAGINVPVLHIGAHTMRGIRKRDYPAFYSYQEPWWGEFHHISKWLSGIGYEMSRGRWIEEVLVISPIESIRCTHGPDGEFTDTEREISAAYRELCDHLMDIGVGFDIGDEKILKEYAAVSDGMLTVGRCGYHYIIVSRGLYLSESTWELLEKFHEHGGTVVFTDGIPRRGAECGAERGSECDAERGSECDAERDTECDAEQDTEFGTDQEWFRQCAVVSNARRFWLKYFASIHFKRKVSLYDQSGFYLAAGLNVSVKEDRERFRAYIWNLQTDSSRELLLKAEGEKRIFLVDPETLRRTELEGACIDGDGNTVIPIRLVKKQSLLLEMEPGELKRPEEDRLECRQQVAGEFIRDQDNCLTIDYASFSLDGKNYSEPYPIVKLHPILYEELGRRSSDRIYVRYEFENRIKGPCDGLKAVIEERDCIDLLCNQNSVLSQRQGWYMDREFGVYPIGEHVRNGKNVLELVYRLKQKEVKGLEGAFETEVNRFFYPVEPEAVYLLGDFGVKAGAEPKEYLTHLRVEAGQSGSGFYLTDSVKLQGMRDMTPQGLWFYRGDLSMKLSLLWKQGEQLFVEVKNPKAAFVGICCNGHSNVSYMPPYRIDLSNHLHSGYNEVILTLHGTNRNLLGPHHHVKGENLFVGCNTFKGQKGYEDTMFNGELGPNTWTDDYSFVPFGCEGIEVIRIEENNIKGGKEAED